MDVKIASQDGSQSRHPSSGLSWQETKIISVNPGSSLKEVTELMRTHQVGDVLVMSPGDEQNVLGIITDRDIALCLAENENFAELSVEDVMSASPVMASTSDDIFKLVQTMKTEGVTRLPLMADDGRVIGVVTAKNLIELLTGALIDLTQISHVQKENERTQH